MDDTVLLSSDIEKLQDNEFGKKTKILSPGTVKVVVKGIAVENSPHDLDS